MKTIEWTGKLMFNIKLQFNPCYIAIEIRLEKTNQYKNF